MKDKHPLRIEQGFKKYYFSKDRNVFKWLWLVIKSLFQKGDILFAKGSHIITGYPGARQNIAC